MYQDKPCQDFLLAVLVVEADQLDTLRVAVDLDTLALVTEREVDMRKLLLVFGAVIAMACSQTPQEKLAAQIKQVQEDSAAEAQLQSDSLKFLALFTPDTVAVKNMAITPWEDEDDDGNVIKKADTAYYFRGRQGFVVPGKPPFTKFCLVNLYKYNTTKIGDVVKCQWTNTLKLDDN